MTSSFNALKQLAGLSPELITIAAMRQRRERIATAALQGLLAANVPAGIHHIVQEAAKRSVALADALIAELDREEE
jgi:hypothetical protein